MRCQPPFVLAATEGYSFVPVLWHSARAALHSPPSSIAIRPATVLPKKTKGIYDPIEYKNRGSTSALRKENTRIEPNSKQHKT
jgi:hypothetical protein